MQTRITLENRTEHTVENDTFLVVKKPHELKPGDIVMLHARDDILGADADDCPNSCCTYRIVKITTEDIVRVNGTRFEFLAGAKVQVLTGVKEAHRLELGNQIRNDDPKDTANPWVKVTQLELL